MTPRSMVMDDRKPPRTILHLDLDAFFCAVEERDRPELRGLPFAVGGRPEGRGVVASCSYAARKFGVRSAMPMARAVRLCPDLLIVRHRHGVYSQASREVMERLRKVSPVIEQISIDEAFLDISGLPDAGDVLARRLQAEIQRELDLPSSLGVAPNKLVAKIATEFGKAAYRGNGPPNAVTVVPPGQEAAFLAPLPVEALWGVGPKTGARLASMGIRTIGDLARLPEATLAEHFGKVGHDLARRARGVDSRPVAPRGEAKSVSRETTFPRDVHTVEDLAHTLDRLCHSVSERLHRKALMGVTVKLKIRWPDFTTLTRQLTLSQATDREADLRAAAGELLATVWEPGRPVRLIGVGVSGLRPAVRQLTLWEVLADQENQEQRRRLQTAVAALQARFGPGVVRWGVRGE